ncbi:TonB-dependent receptor [Altererythrobacter sp. GH1-8]|uniref:TonB-dependent receptor n=1 Tax=Altererythrobacter sp. GH1-8 TaxID=3349333 RepID=UPI00374CEBC7
MERKLASYAAGLLVGTCLASPAFAQDTDTEAQAPQARDNVIIVTATRRAEDVQDIPIAVTAVSPEQLDKQGVVNVQNISQVAPSFSSSNAQLASGSVVLRIRGVGTTSNNIGFESAVGIFVDGAYQSRPGVALSEFVDVERVEVLRGPQGTLFGRNTSAGALNITNRRPDLGEFGGFANATYGNFDLMSLQGAVNVPLIQDTLALRVTGAYRERDGFYDLIDRNGNDVGESNAIDQHLLRGQLGWETEGGIRGRLIVDYSKSNAPFGAALEVLQSPVETAGLFNLVGLGPRGGMAAPDVATSPNDVVGAQAAVDDRISTVNFEPTTKVKNWGVTGEIEIPVGDNADLIYIGSYREFDATEAYDSDFSGLDVFDVTGNFTNIKTMTHELRLQGEAMDGRLTWMVGGYYADEKIAQEVNFALGADYGELIGALLFAPTAGAFGPNPLTVISGVDPAGTTNTNLYSQDSKSWSIFTHNTFEITDGLDFTVGLRWSDESKDGAFAQGDNANALCPALLGTLNLAQLQQGNLVFGPAPAALGPTLLGTGCFAFTAPADLPLAAFLPLPRTFDDKFKDDELIWTVKLGYEITPDVSTYASFTHGYKSGGFNLDSTAAAGGADPRFASEEVDAYEVGMKARFLDDAVTLNVAGFHEEFTNFQVLEFTGAQFQTFNVPSAKTTGVEIESVIRPDDHFTFNAAVSYTDARYPENCAGDQTAVNVVALCGNSLTNNNDIVAILGANYEREVGNNFRFFINGQARLESDARTSTQAVILPSAAQIAAAGGVQAAVDAAAPLPFDEQDGNVKVNLRAGIGAEDESWTLEVWGTNITNEVTRGVTFNTVLRSGSRSAFILEPRTYGVTLRTKF